MNDNDKQQVYRSRRPQSGQRKHVDRAKAFQGKIFRKNFTALVAKNLEDVPYTVFDIESTGGNPERNAITEICALKVVKGKVVDKFYSLVNPKMPIPPIVRRMTGIDNKMVRDAPVIADVMPGFVRFIEDSVLVSHNTIGDMKFLRYYSEQTVGTPIENFFLCTHLLVERLVSEAPNRSLKGLAQHFSFVPKGEVHRADADAYLTLDLFNELYSRFPKHKILTLGDAIRFQGDYESGMRLGWALPPATLDAAPHGPGVFELYDRLGRLHFASSAVSLKRDAKRLLRYQQLPKAMLRLVLNSYHMKFRECASFFEAVFDESKILSTHKNLLRPSQWHQRSTPSICITVSKTDIEMYMGDLQKDVIAAYGPIGDRKELGRMLSKVVEACGGQAGREFRCSLEFKTLLCEFFAGRLDAYEAKLAKSYKRIWNQLIPGGKQKASRQILALEALKKIKLPSGLTALNEMKGLLVVKSKEVSVYDLYRLRYGRIYSAGTYKGALEDFPKAASLIKRQLKQLASRKGFHMPLTHAEAMHANAVFWWVMYQSGGADGHYYSAGELAGMKV